MVEQDSERRHEEQLTGASNASGVGAYLFHRVKPYLPPWVAVGGLGIAGAAGSTLWEGSAAAGVGLTLASVALTATTWWAGKSTGEQRRLHSAITVAAGSAWATAACLAGPLAGPIPHLYAMGGAGLALSWNIRAVLRRNVDGTAEGAGDKGLLEKVGLARTTLGTAKVEPNKVTVPYALPQGEGTNDDMAKALPRIASALDVSGNAVRFRPDPDSVRKGELVIVPEDKLKEVVWWPGPSAPGGSIAEPLVIGRYDDGRELQLPVLEALHLLIMGVTGSGKTEGALDVLAEVLTRRDVMVWLSDPKRGQDLGEAFGACDWVVDTPDGAAVMIEATATAVAARQKWLGDHGYRSWCPEAADPQTDPAHSCRTGGACGCAGMPFLVAWFEEAANTLRAVDDDVFTGVAQEARSAGIWLVISMQRASGYQISTDTRASLPASLCFGVDERDAAFALPSDVLDAGANPGAWGNKKPGYCYLVARGVDDPLWSTPSRTFRNDPVALAWVTREFASVRAVVDPVTAGAAASIAGQLYTGRALTEHTGPVPAARRELEDTDVTEDDGTTTALVDPEDAGIDPEAELPDPQDGDDTPIFGQESGRKPSPQEARRLFADALAEFEANGQMIVGPKDFLDWCDGHGLSRSWVSLRLKEAAMEGRLEQTNATGRWRIVPALTPA
ncbi:MULTISPECIES: plasmid transfer protein TraB [unclassified Streptomyces]|uniref:plasmid transfer protein TraB n=1 Tax=unclassified Streptomyces TaxID=2593676 RepID=UPI000DD525D3|nr:MULTISPECIES: plasmid transfer protein TraB [unclassified Streptomyces]QZZ28831.1 sporulation protein SsgA [Streptomyces sp. ST1015]